MGWSPHQSWAEHLVTIGRSVRVSGSTINTPIEGTARSVDEWGRLIVEDENGRLHTLAAGDVSLRG
jgi:biotin-(acetyl-CoA carboxylase) ligase